MNTTNISAETEHTRADERTKSANDGTAIGVTAERTVTTERVLTTIHPPQSVTNFNVNYVCARCHCTGHERDACRAARVATAADVSLMLC